MDIVVPNLLVQCLAGGGIRAGDPSVRQGTLGIVVGILQLSLITVVQRDGDVLRLSTPITLGTDGAMHAGESFGDSTGSRVRDG